MNVSINIKVIDPFWIDLGKREQDYLTKFSEPEDLECTKYVQKVCFDFDSNIVEYRTNRKTCYDLPIIYPDEKTGDTIITTYQIADVTYVEFIDKDGANLVIISNELIHSFFGAQQKGRAHYWYVYIDGNTEYHQQLPNIWLSTNTLSGIFKKYPTSGIVINKKARVKTMGGLL